MVFIVYLICSKTPQKALTPTIVQKIYKLEIMALWDTFLTPSMGINSLFKWGAISGIQKHHHKKNQPFEKIQ